MTAWRAQDDDIEDDLYCAIESAEINEWAEYLKYCDEAKERREIAMDFEIWLEAREAERKRGA
jgi:hypothetical protein